MRASIPLRIRMRLPSTRLPRQLVAMIVTAFAALAFAQVSGAQEFIRGAPLQYEPSTPAADTAAPKSSAPTTATARPRSVPVYDADGSVAVPVASEKAMRYYYSGLVIWLLNAFLGMAILLVLCFSGFAARMRDFAQRAGSNWFLTIVLYWALFSTLLFLVKLPLSYYAGFVNEHAFGLSNQTHADWMIYKLKSLAVTIAGGALVLWIPYLLLKKSPTRWWFYAGLAAFPVVVFSIFIQPIVIEPIFNDFGPVKNPALEQKILKLAERSGIEHARVFEVDKSRETKSTNAYVTGIGQTQRIVFWDTLTASMSDEQVLSVMGHEIGHYVLNHIWKLIAFTLLLMLLMLYIVHRLAHMVISRFQRRLGFTMLSDIASLPLILLLLSTTSIVHTPIGNAVNRQVEHEADVFTLELTRDNRAAAEGFVQLIDDNLDNPRPHWLDQLLRGSHPTNAERIEFANTYKPWMTGQPLRYGALIKPEK